MTNRTDRTGPGSTMGAIDCSSLRTVLLDVDGVLYRGSAVLPGAADLLALLHQRSIAYVCLTNNGSMTPQQYERKLAGMGISVSTDHILTAAMATSRALRGTYPHGTPVYAIGMEGLHEALFAEGYFVWEEDHPRVVVLGPDFAVTYEKLRRGCLAIRGGADFILTNPDTTLPTEAGQVPDAGALAAALQAATGVAPLVIGKPQPTMYRMALEMVGGTAETALMVGDRLETDIAGARSTGLSSILVLTGVSRREELATTPHQPDAVFEDLTTLLSAMRQAMLA